MKRTRDVGPLALPESAPVIEGGSREGSGRLNLQYSTCEAGSSPTGWLSDLLG